MTPERGSATPETRQAVVDAARRVRRAEARLEAQLVARDRAIVAMAADGASVRAIATAAGLKSPNAVQKILNRTTTSTTTRRATP